MKIPGWQRGRGLRGRPDNVVRETPNAATSQIYRVSNYSAVAQATRRLSTRAWATFRRSLSMAFGVAVLSVILQPAWGQEFAMETSTLETIEGIADGGEFTLASAVASVEPGWVSGGEFELAAEIGVLTPEPATVSPTISIIAAGSQVIIEWPISAADYILDQSAALSATAIWTPVSTPYVTNATHISVALSAPVGTRFYRLSKPAP